MPHDPTSKAELRRHIRKLRARLDLVTLVEAGRAVAARLATVPELREASVVATYHAIRRELPTDAIRSALPRARWAIPRLVAHGAMRMVLEVEPLYEGDFGIPTCDGPSVVPDVVLVPGLAFDTSGQRLGWGQGHYDRYFAAHPDPFTIGLALDEVIVPKIPTEPHDRPLDLVVTPTRILRAVNR